MPKVSIIMNCLNRQDRLREAVDSIYAQTFQDWEIIFWDNASTDNSGAEAQRGRDARLRYFRGERTVPLGAARNLALKQARGEYIAFLDTDDIWFPQKLEKQLPLFDDPEVALVFSNAIVYRTNINKRTEHFPSHQRLEKGKGFSYLFEHYSHMLNMQTIVIRSSVLAEVGQWFEEDYQICTDFDFFLRVAYRWKYDFVYEPLVEYRVHDKATMVTMNHHLPAELEKTIQKFKKLFPKFEKANAPIIAQYEKTVDLLWGKYYWTQGDGARAREYYGTRLWSSAKVPLFYVATFLPYKIVRKTTDQFQKYF